MATKQANNRTTKAARRACSESAPASGSETPKLNRRQLNTAARLYTLASTALADCEGAETIEERRVMMRAIRRADQCLKAMGYDRTELLTIKHCIKAALESPNDGDQPPREL